MIKLGVVGFSEGNGHPFSFSSIVNGYSDEGFAGAGWDGIHAYLSRKDPTADFGFPDVRVSHAWTQDADLTATLCGAAKIENAVGQLEDMLGSVDALLLTRDDCENHLSMALPFLAAGTPVYCDKPLSLDVDELKAFRPYLDAGKLMSCSGMRYALEIDEARAGIAAGAYGDIRMIRGAVVLDWEHYGVHMVDAILNLYGDRATPVSVTRLPASHDSMAIEMSDGSVAQIDAMGACPKNFRIDVFGESMDSSHQLFDNFTAFRRTLASFLSMVSTVTPPIAPTMVMNSMKILIAGRTSETEHRTVKLDEFDI